MAFSQVDLDNYRSSMTQTSVPLSNADEDSVNEVVDETSIDGKKTFVKVVNECVDFRGAIIFNMIKSPLFLTIYQD